MSSPHVYIKRVGMTSAVGIGAAQTAASVRAGIVRFKESDLTLKNSAPMVMANVPDAYLGLTELLSQYGTHFSDQLIRMLALATPALKEVIANDQTKAKYIIYLGLPHSVSPSLASQFLSALANASALVLDLQQSRIFCQGRAAGLMAMHYGSELVRNGQANRVIVGGVDSFYDAQVIRPYDNDNRVLCQAVKDGFVPGEGAGFLLLSADEKTNSQSIMTVLSTSIGEESGHRYSERPYRGDGLANTVKQLFDDLPSVASPVESVYAGFNGEHWFAKEWGVSYIRNQRYFAEHFEMHHPADKFGDTGAASGPLLAGIATIACRKAYTKSPCLVFCSSDHQQRAAVLLSKEKSE